MMKEKLKKAVSEDKISPRMEMNFLSLYEQYKEAFKLANIPFEPQEKIFEIYLDKVLETIQNPYSFLPYHEKVRAPFDYYKFGIDFVRRLVEEDKSKVIHFENVEKMVEQVKKNENVVLFANHQTEADPQLISIALEKTFPDFAENMIFVAGDRVLTDPLAVCFSMGRNLLCIYSKRHIDNPPEKKLMKQEHNRKTMKLLKDLLAMGGKVIYVAPSGGRDRANEEGTVEIAPFDPQSIEMFKLMASESKRTTHFYPLALDTYNILPPPKTIGGEVGEMRLANRGPIFFDFCNELDMQNFPGNDMKDRHERRAAFAQYIWSIVKNAYDDFKK